MKEKLLLHSLSSVRKVLCDANSLGKKAKGYNTLLVVGGLHDVYRGFPFSLSLYLIFDVSIMTF